MEGYNYKDETFVDSNIDFEQISNNIRKRTYNYLGAGSGRMVFDLGNGNVVKAAKNRRGTAQNEAEYKIALENNTHLLAKISQISEGSTMLIMEKAEKIRSISFVWEYFKVRSNSQLYKVEELKEICNKCNLEIRDFGRSANWGKINGKPIIIDYGFTHEVYRKYYMTRARFVLHKLRG